jgi:hypothetical protein
MLYRSRKNIANDIEITTSNDMQTSSLKLC